MMTIRIDTGKAEAGAAAQESINVTHIAAHEVRIGGGRTSLDVSPGVLLVMPQSDNLRALIGSDIVKIPQGMGLVVAGDTQKSLIKEQRQGEQDDTEVSTRLIEIGALLNGAVTLMEHLDLPVLLDYETSSKLSTLYERLFVTQETLILPGGSADVYGEFLRAELVMMLLTVGAAQACSQPPSDEDVHVVKLKRYLMANLDSRLSAPQMASHMGMSATTLIRWTRKVFHTSPARYFKELRLQRGLELLSQGELGIEAIADQTGFPDRYHFSKEFRKRFGTSPAQFRKASCAVPGTDFLGQANAYFRQGEFKKALRTCTQGLQQATSSATRSQILYHQGRCLRALGDSKGAMTVWAELQDSPYDLQAGSEQCRMFFALGSHDKALETFRALYERVDDRQKQELIHLWMDQVVLVFTLHRTSLLRKYMALRGELFPRHLASMRLSVDALRVLEENEEVLEQCAQIHPACFHALRRAGRLDEALALCEADDAVELLVQFGRHEEAEVKLAEDPNPVLRARLLTHCGRATEAIEQSPTTEPLAYLQLGRAKELLTRFPDFSLAHVYALSALGNTEQLKNVSPDAPSEWLHAQLCIRPEAILDSTLPDALTFHGRARLLMTIDALQRGEREEAESILAGADSICSPELWWEDHTDVELIVACVLRGMLSGPERLRSDLDHIVGHFKYKMRQVLWHDAAFLSGVISEATYMEQPNRCWIDTRFSFIQALAQDLKGRQAEAREAYRPFAECFTPHHSGSLIQQRFARWRLQAR